MARVDSIEALEARLQRRERWFGRYLAVRGVLGLGLLELAALALLHVLGHGGGNKVVMSNEFDPTGREVVMKGSKGTRTLRLYPAVSKVAATVATLPEKTKGLE